MKTICLCEFFFFFFFCQEGSGACQHPDRCANCCSENKELLMLNYRARFELLVIRFS